MKKKKGHQNSNRRHNMTVALEEHFCNMMYIMNKMQILFEYCDALRHLVTFVQFKHSPMGVFHVF